MAAICRPSPPARISRCGCRTGSIRKYSLCNDPAERDRYQIAVKREDSRPRRLDQPDRQYQGRRRTGSISAPVNDFRAGRNAADYFLFIAGGIGITPIMAMMRALKRDPAKQYKLYYCTRTPEMTAFRDELSAPEFEGKVVIHHDGGDPAQARSTSGRSSRSARTARISIAAARAA